MNPYEALANAIVEQAATDHRNSVQFLRDNPRTQELEYKVAAQVRERKARIRARKENGLPSEKEEQTEEGKLLARIRECEELIKDTEEFFLSSWFSELTDLDGRWLLEKIRRMEGERDGD